mmetsp:Transcript_24139/g.57556  ORF Transcript_24139/g.57556 Transcript_24139/m.57556 type:complete len:386 (+) Transcript_24139:245-1402(+)
MSKDAGAEEAALLKDTVESVLVKSVEMPPEAIIVKGYDFNNGVDHNALLSSFLTSGFQASNFGMAVNEINRMRAWRLSDDPIAEDEDDELKDMEVRSKIKSTIFLGYTSNMASCGVRETIRYLCEHKMVDVIVATAGGVEEDFIKCLAPTYLGSGNSLHPKCASGFELDGRTLRLQGLNRIGNMVVPNENYVLFESWLMPILDTMLDEQTNDGVLWTPSSLIRRLGLEIGKLPSGKESIYYWCAINDIPVFSPALTDGSIGDMLFFHSYKRTALVVDVVGDIRGINMLAMKARHTGAIIIGGGVVKHHIMNANLMRNGCDHAVLVNTGQEFDGSDSGARPDEAISWGKIKLESKPVKVYAEATIVFPLLVAQTFAKDGPAPGVAK